MTSAAYLRWPKAPIPYYINTGSGGFPAEIT
ncbi:unnamed protein product [Strongylus vulgaris]|uniref:Uncharacterized protein n=1 Tax=Strongylus vulgaris TaxID=40348 RepID=A0A3P7JVY4_STRVU|nr:unnamed protein product [Strongylus vulgaris]